MNVEKLIMETELWQAAIKMPDRHYDKSEGISLADHLMATAKNLRFILKTQRSLYCQSLQNFLRIIHLTEVEEILIPVSLLHDIGKVEEDKTKKIAHPFTGKLEAARHPLIAFIAANQFLPSELRFRSPILALIEEHDTPYAWYRQYQKAGQIPKKSAWHKLDAKIEPKADGTGLLLLCIFKLVDIDGHQDMSDAQWFIRHANEMCLAEKGKQMLIPSRDDLTHISEN